jgi:hypothetical protein
MKTIEQIQNIIKGIEDIKPEDVTQFSLGYLSALRWVIGETD